MLRLSQVKLDLGLEPVAIGDDASLLSFIRQAAAIARTQTGRFLHCATETYTLASQVVTVTAPAHGLVTGETITLRNTGTSLDGERVVTSAPTPHTFKFAFTDALTGTATAGSAHPRRQFKFAGNNSQKVFAPQNSLPWYAVNELAIWDGSEWTAVDSEDFTATPDAQGKAAKLELTGTEGFPRLATLYAGQFGRTRFNSDPTVRLTVDLGAEVLPADLEMALLSIVADLYERQGGGRDLQNVSVGGSSRAAFTGTEKFEQRYSPDNVFLNWKAML